MSKSNRKLWISLPAAALFFLLFFAVFPLTASAAEATDIKYSPLFEASLQNTIREFAEKESGEYYKRANDAVAEKADSADAGDTETNPKVQVVAYGIPGVPSIPSYTSSYSCGATCGSTCGSTCAGSSTCVGSSTCASSSTCFGSSTCAGSSTCVGASTCVGGSTCLGTSTCLGASSCAGSSTCFGTSTCSGTSTCIGTSTCSGTTTCGLGSGICTTTPTNPTPTNPTPTNPSPSNPLPETPTPPNDDTKPSSWAEAQVNEAIEYGFVPAELQKNYKSNITRKEFCTLTIQFLKQILATDPEFEGVMDIDIGESPFTDVDDTNVTWAYYLDIVSGVGGGKFNPDGQITRQEAATMLMNMVENVFLMDVSAGPANFSDAGQISGWAKDSVDFVYKHGIMSGVGNNTFAPLNPYTREQSIVTIIRMFNALVLEE